MPILHSNVGTDDISEVFVLTATEVPQLDSFVVGSRHNDAVTELQARHTVSVVT